MRTSSLMRNCCLRLVIVCILPAFVFFSCVTPSPVPVPEAPSPVPAPAEPAPADTPSDTAPDLQPAPDQPEEPPAHPQTPSQDEAPALPEEPSAFTPLIPETWGAGQPSSVIAEPGIKSPYQLYTFFMAHNPDADALKVARLASYYVEEGLAEGINSDIAFVQMCLETGWLKFGNLVTVDMNNFCGLGAIDREHPGNRFESERMGVRAHIQHLHAYGTTGALNRTCIDERYKWVNPRGKAPTVAELSGTWAADRQYGAKLQKLLDELAAF